MDAPQIIAEVGCNHMGDFNIAKKMIHVAATFCEVDVVKFQKRTPHELLSPEEYNKPHPVPDNAYGDTYGEHREALEFSIDQHAELKKLTEDHDLIYSSSVWDLTSARQIASLRPHFIKVPSASNLDFEMLALLCDTYQGKLHISLGMTTHDEERKIVAFLTARHRNKDTVLYACTSGYPVPFEDLALLEISRLVDTFGKDVESIGFSGHHSGIAMDVAAVTLGARYVERHFTLNRTWKGTDHAASLEPDGMRRLSRDLRNVAIALAPKKQEILEIEMQQRKKLKRKIAG
jgi:sialic acid synthase